MQDREADLARLRKRFIATASDNIASGRANAIAEVGNKSRVPVGTQVGDGPLCVCRR